VAYSDIKLVSVFVVFVVVVVSSFVSFLAFFYLFMCVFCCLFVCLCVCVFLSTGSSFKRSLECGNGLQCIVHSGV